MTHSTKKEGSQLPPKKKRKFRETLLKCEQCKDETIERRDSVSELDGKSVCEILQSYHRSTLSFGGQFSFILTVLEISRS